MSIFRGSKKLAVEGLKEQRAEPGKMRDTMREVMDSEGLSKEQKQRVAENMCEAWRPTQCERMDESCTVSTDNNVAVFDRQIDEFRMTRIAHRTIVVLQTHVGPIYRCRISLCLPSGHPYQQGDTYGWLRCLAAPIALSVVTVRGVGDRLCPPA